MNNDNEQAARILAILDAADLDFLVERTPDGWRVETEQRGNVEGHIARGASLLDCLAQLTTTLAAELELGPELVAGAGDDDEPIPFAVLDMPIPFVLDVPVEYCAQFMLGEPAIPAKLTA